MSYYFFVGETMLPVPPDKMSIKINNANKTLTLINEGEINIIKTAGLTDISFDARLPNSDYPYADYANGLLSGGVSALSRKFLGQSLSFKKASYFLEKFKAAKQNKEPIRLIISRFSPSFQMLFDTNMLVTLEDYSIEEDAGDGFDVTVPLHFKQYRPYATKEIEVSTDANGNKKITVKETRPVEDKTTPAVYKMIREKSVWEAVRGVAGGSVDYRQIMKNSGITNPLSKVGTVLNFGKT